MDNKESKMNSQYSNSNDDRIMTLCAEVDFNETDDRSHSLSCFDFAMVGVGKTNYNQTMTANKNERQQNWKSLSKTDTMHGTIPSADDGSLEAMNTTILFLKCRQQSKASCVWEWSIGN